jgi:GNAT superfamily N-acetyltransferase
MSIIIIKEIAFAQILTVWANDLWPGRSSSIDARSAIKYGAFPYEYDAEYMSSEYHCFGAFEDKQLIGVNSGHVSGESFRSRGLFVFPEYRGKQVGVALLNATIDKALDYDSKFVWSMPRSKSLTTYERSGFVKTSEWFSTETSDNNCFVKIDL